MSENQDTLKITIQFNGKKIQLQEVGTTALPTFQKMLDVFRNPTESDDSSNKAEITDYA